MQIVHPVGLRAGELARTAFLEAGVELGSGSKSAGMVSFEISEGDPRWPKVYSLFGRFKIFDAVTTRFSDAELEKADCLGMAASGLHGYPEPSDDGGYLSATFDLAGHCRRCGTEGKQTTPFRLKKAPALGKKILQLNWILDEYFVTPGVWASTFQPLGIGCRPVVLDKTGRVIDSVVQLAIEGSSEVQLEDVPHETCEGCGRTKHRYSLHGFYPRPVHARGAIFKSSQSFGSGGQAFHRVLVSNELYRNIHDAGLRGVTFYPCKSSRAE